jgi:hypothetical protein
MRTTFLVSILVVTLGGSAGSTGATVANGIQGVVLRGPTTPVCMAERPCSSPVVGALVTARRASSSLAAIAARGHTDLKGRFRFALAPGSYVVTVAMGSATRSLRPPRSSTRRVLVRSGRFTNVRFVFDTGIR